MFEALHKDANLDVMVGSRYVEGGGIDAWEAVARLSEPAGHAPEP